MTDRNLQYPSLCGVLALSDKVPLLDNNDTVRRLFVDSLMEFVIYQIGHPTELQVHSTSDEVFIVLGRIYQPQYRDAVSGECKEPLLQHIAAMNPREIEGNYLSIHFSRTKSGKLQFILTTDKYGFRMLLYYRKANLLYFSTHLSGLKYLLRDKLPGLQKTALLHYYHFGITPNDQTLLEDIKKVPPASVLSIAGKEIRVTKYLQLGELYHPDRYADASEAHICEEINTLMSNSIIKRNPCKKPVGVSISGGVDSGFVAKKLMENGVEVLGYNVSYGHDYYNEHDRLNILAKNIGIKIRKLQIAAEEILNGVELINRLGSEPVGFNYSAMWLLAREVRKDGIETLWDGDGADRLFFGMNSFLKHKRVTDIYKILKKLGMIGPVTHILKQLKNNEYKKLYVVFENWQRGMPPYPERKYGQIKSYNEQYERYIHELAIKKYWDNFLSEFASEDIRLYFAYQAINMCPEMFFYPVAEQQYYLGLFPISPYWDHEIVALALSIPMHLKTKRGKTKYILRKAAVSKDGKDEKYWMLPKVGLQNSFNYVVSTPEGKKWRNEQHKIIIGSEEYNLINAHLNGRPIDLDRLIPLNLWKTTNHLTLSQ